MRRNMLRTAIVIVAMLASGAVPIERTTADPAAVESWSSPVPLGIIGIHAALLPSRKVLFSELPGSTLARARVFDPATNTSTPVDPTLDWSVFCSSMSFLADGRLFATGGEPPRTAEDPIGTGIENAAFFDPGTGRWTGAAPMRYPRWYPSNVQMLDGTTLVMGGEATPTGADQQIGPMESYRPLARSLDDAPAVGEPEGPVPPRDAAARPGGVVLLPGSTSVLTSGGKPGGKPVTATTETIDLTAAAPRWRYTDPMNHARMHHNLVLLPTGG